VPPLDLPLAIIYAPLPNSVQPGVKQSYNAWLATLMLP
jgi:hypothetical protein